MFDMQKNGKRDITKAIHSIKRQKNNAQNILEANKKKKLNATSSLEYYARIHKKIGNIRIQSYFSMLWNSDANSSNVECVLLAIANWRNLCQNWSGLHLNLFEKYLFLGLRCGKIPNISQFAIEKPNSKTGIARARQPQTYSIWYYKLPFFLAWNLLIHSSYFI